MQVKFTLKSLKDLSEISDYIAYDNPIRAQSFIKELMEKARQITIVPKAFPFIDIELQIRKRSYKGYVILYQTFETHIEILHIINSRRDYAHLLK